MIYVGSFHGRRFPPGIRVIPLGVGINLRFSGRPLLCRGASRHCRVAVAEALDSGLPITCAGAVGIVMLDFAVENDGGVIVDMSSMTSVYLGRGKWPFIVWSQVPRSGCRSPP